MRNKLAIGGNRRVNLAHVARKNIKKKKLKQTKQCPFNSVQAKIREGSPEGIKVKGFMKEINFKTGVKGRGSDIW